MRESEKAERMGDQTKAAIITPQRLRAVASISPRTQSAALADAADEVERLTSENAALVDLLRRLNDGLNYEIGCAGLGAEVAVALSENGRTDS